MALQKTLSLKNGATGNYFKISLIHHRIVEKEVSVHFSLYSSQDNRNQNPGHPLLLTVAKLRLQGEIYDRYLSSEALQGSNHVSQLYKAAKAERVISDYDLPDSPLFSDATDV